MEDIAEVVDPPEKTGSAIPSKVTNGIQRGVKVTLNGSSVLVESRRWVSKLELHRYIDGSFRIGDRQFPPRADGSSAQWGRTGQGGGGGGSKPKRKSRSGGTGAQTERETPGYVGTPVEFRGYRLPSEVRARLDYTFSKSTTHVRVDENTKKSKKKGKKKQMDGEAAPLTEKRGGRPQPKTRRGRTPD